MRSKLFLAFFIVILTALVSNLIFEHLIIKDFEEYVMSASEDQIYVMLATVEGTYGEDGWHEDTLANALLWTLMLGYETEVRDPEGATVLSAKETIETLPPAMKRRLEALVLINSPVGEFETYPLYVGGEEVGSLEVRPLRKKGLQEEKEAIYKHRGRTFLLISFVIAGGGALFLSFVFSSFLTGPIKRLTRAAEAVAAGDLKVRVRAGSRDEIGTLTETFNHMVEALEREETLRKHLSSNIAHELRTPLAVMRASLEAAMDGVVKYDSDKLKTFLAEVNRLTHLVEGIEDVTKAEASFFTPAEYERVSLRGLLEGIMQGMRPMFSEKDLNLNISDKGDMEVVADAAKVERVVTNILANSLAHTEKGSVRVDYGMDKREFYIEVADSGRGMTEDEIQKVFERFYRGRDSQGLGLGLSIAKELIDVMQGSIEIKSAPGKGTTVRIALPLREVLDK
jgi:two-component system sensor histidine kinase BaeS